LVNLIEETDALKDVDLFGVLAAYVERQQSIDVNGFGHLLRDIYDHLQKHGLISQGDLVDFFATKTKEEIGDWVVHQECVAFTLGAFIDGKVLQPRRSGGGDHESLSAYPDHAFLSREQKKKQEYYEMGPRLEGLVTYYDWWREAA